MLTVLFATHNGSQTLAQTLQSFTKLDAPDGGFEVIVVDNASTDRTPEIISSFVGALPLKTLRIEQQGKNIALNAGLALAEGDIIVLTDDDVIPRPDWLVQHRAMAKTQPSAALWGGAIEPIWPKPPAPWIIEHVPLGAVFALTDPHQESGTIAPDMIWGPNMAVRRSVFEEGHRFNEKVGPAAGQYTMGSETEFTCRVAAEGFNCWFLREAVVGHQIRVNQMEREWIVKRAFRFGKAKYHREKKLEGPSFRNVPRWRYGAMVYSSVSSLRSALFNNHSEKFKADWDREYHRGYISAAWSEFNGH